MRLICNRLGGFLVVMVAVLAASASAVAESGILPRPGTIGVTSGGAKFVFKNGLTVKFTSDEGTHEYTSDKAGRFDILLLNATGLLGVKCTGEKDTTAGSILMFGTFAIVKLTSTEPVPHGIVYSPTETKFRLWWYRICVSRTPRRTNRSCWRSRNDDLRTERWRE